LALRSDEVLPAAEAGVVDENLDVQAQLGDATRQIATGRVVGQVRPHHLRAPAEALRELIRQGSQAILATSDARHAVAVAGELARDGLADAGRRAGDQCGRRVGGLGYRHGGRLPARAGRLSGLSAYRRPVRIRLTPK